MPLKPAAKKTAKKTAAGEKVAQPKVDFVREEVTRLLPRWTIIQDVLGGQLEIKAKGTEYLVMPNADDQSPENLAGYNSRLKRAVFYNVTGRTHAGYVGQVFAKEPSLDLPAQMEFFADDIDGSGVQLNQQAKLALGYVLGYGRAGLLADYPQAAASEDGVVQPTTVAQLKEGNIRPTINLYRPESIINWRERTIGSVTVPSLIVLVEQYLAEDDGFKPTFADQWRVLRLEMSPTGDVYTVEIFRKGTDGFESQGVNVPTGADGKPFDRIPFTFIGVNDNNSEPDEPPLLDLALLNLAHYNNSADNEDSVYLVGMPMFWFGNLSESWVKKVLGGKVRVGSASAVLLPEGGTAGILQAEGNTMAFTNMEHKEKQMVALGAKLVEVKTVQRTATEAGMTQASETSILTSAANNVSQAYRAAFLFVGRFLGTATSDDAIAYELNTDLGIMQLDPQAQAAIVASWQAGVMDYEEARWNFRRAGLVYKDDEEVKANVEAELAAAVPRDANGNPVKVDANGNPIPEDDPENEPDPEPTE